MNDAPTAPTGDTALTYSYRPSLLGAPWDFELSHDVLRFQAGNKTGRIPLRNIRRIRMSFRPITMQSQRYLTEIWAEQAPKLEICSSSWRSMIEQERRDSAYAIFIAELHKRVSRVGTPVLYERGTGPLRYWLGAIVFVAVAAVLAALIVRGLQAETWRGTAVVGAFAVFFIWQVGNYFRRNRPGQYEPDELPVTIMPKRP